MTCPTCGDSNTDEIRAIWREYQSAIRDIENIAEAKTLLRTYFSKEDNTWTEEDEKIGSALCGLDQVTMTLIDLAAAHKGRHTAASAEHDAMMQASAAAIEAMNEAKAAESQE